MTHRDFAAGRITTLPQPGQYGNPVGPSAPLRQVYPVLPNIGAPVFSTVRNMRYGRGIVVSVTAAANAPVTIAHNLGRIPQGIAVLNNSSGTLTNPRMMLNAGATPTRTQATIQGDLAMTNCLVHLF